MGIEADVRSDTTGAGEHLPDFSSGTRSRRLSSATDRARRRLIRVRSRSMSSNDGPPPLWGTEGLNVVPSGAGAVAHPTAWNALEVWVARAGPPSEPRSPPDRGFIRLAVRSTASA